MSYEISDVLPDEENFVLASWKTSLLNTDAFRDKPKAAAYAYLNPHVNKTFEQSGVLVARQGKKILGWVSFEVDGAGDFRLHYIYVKFADRKRGVGRELLLAALENSPGAGRTLYTQATTRFAEVAARYDLELAP
jgi:ribosomal protein S18 acetylase RimI-like enzyme